jgi:trehalose/maltose hydrolase-like predicted phosphorylase
VKQADVVALIGLLPEEFPPGMTEVNFRHYEPLCAHGSSLSAGMHALVAARAGRCRDGAANLKQIAALSHDPGADAAGGVRIAWLGGLWQAVMHGFIGLDLRGDSLGIDPKLPAHWRAVSFRVCWRGRSVRFLIANGSVRAELLKASH